MTYGGFANGIPRNFHVRPSRAPLNVPLSSCTLGLLRAEGAAATVAINARGRSALSWANILGECPMFVAKLVLY